MHSRNLCYLQSYYSIVSILRALVIRCKIVICLNCKLLSGVFRRGFLIYQMQHNEKISGYKFGSVIKVEAHTSTCSYLLAFFLPADLYLFISLAFCSGSHSVAVATFKNATLQCAMCTFTYTFFSSSCSDEGWVICVTGQDDACQGMVSSTNTAGTVAGLVQHEHWAC